MLGRQYEQLLPDHRATIAAVTTEKRATEASARRNRGFRQVGRRDLSTRHKKKKSDQSGYQGGPTGKDDRQPDVNRNVSQIGFRLRAVHERLRAPAARVSRVSRWPTRRAIEIP